MNLDYLKHEVCQFGSLMQNLLMIRRDECQKIN